MQRYDHHFVNKHTLLHWSLLYIQWIVSSVANQRTALMISYIYTILRVLQYVWSHGDTKIIFKDWKISHEWNTFNARKKLLSPNGNVMFYFLYKHQWKSKQFQWERYITILTVKICFKEKAGIYWYNDNEHYPLAHIVS